MGDVPRSDLYDDVYFSKEGGPAETRHVFLDGNDLPRRWQGCASYTIGETGFGTGLNFLLAWKLFDETAPAGALLDFVSVEKHPLSVADIRRGLSSWADDLNPYLEKMLAQYPMRIPGYHRMVFDNRVVLTLIFDDANDALAQIDGQVDTWFLDGFTPSKNPAMWTPEVFSQMARLSHNGTSFATFTAAGFVKRGLAQAGFIPEKKKGFGIKRDMLAGGFAGPTKTTIHSPKSIAILGAGLAGTSCAHVLKQYGFDVTVYDARGIASGASGNPLGLINPRLSALRDEQSDFYASAFAMAHRTYSSIPDIEFNATGALHLVTDDDKQKRFAQTIENWNWLPEHMRLLDASAASDIAGISVDRAALYLPDSAGLSPYKLCHALAGDSTFVKQNITDIKKLDHDVIILANGVGASVCMDLPIHTVRGQITQIRATKQSAALRCNLHYGGYVSAARNGVHTLGATFQPWLDHTQIDEADDTDNIDNLYRAVPSMRPPTLTLPPYKGGGKDAAGGRVGGKKRDQDFSVISSRASLRCASKDRFPIIGHVRDNIYVSTAHGSHGLISSIMGAHLLADYLRDGVKCLPRATIGRLSPERFK